MQGVETFQVLYGTNGVTAGAAPAAALTRATAPDLYLRADQLVVAGDPAGTLANWRRVRSVRIGMVLRGPRNSAQESATQALSPLGAAFVSANDAFSSFPAQTDGRLRQTVTLTIYLHNALGV